MLDENLEKASLSLNYFQQNISFKAVSYGNLVADANPQTTKITAQNLKPYNVTNVNVELSSNNDIEISFDRRSRIITSWSSYNSPLAEQSEKYEIDILDDSDEIVRTIKVNTPNANYTNAQQIEDFGSIITEIKLNIYQISDLIGRGELTAIAN